MTATNPLTNVTLAETADGGLWGDWGSGGGSGQDDNAPVQGGENRSRRIDNGIKGFAIDKGSFDLSAAGTHIGVWIRTFQPGLTNNLGPRLGSNAAGPNNSPWSQWNFAGSNYPIEGPWLRLWFDPSITRDAGAGTLDLTQIQWIGSEFDMGNVGGTSDNCHIDRIDYGTVGIEITNDGTFAEAETIDQANALGILRDGVLSGTISIKSSIDSNFSIKASDLQILAASDWIKIAIDNTDVADNGVDWSGGAYFLDAIPVTINGTQGTVNLGTGTFLNAPAMSWNTSVVFGGGIASSDTLTAGGSDLRGAKFDGSIGTSALIYDETADPGTASGDLAGVEFVSSGTGHGLELGVNSPTAITLTNNSFTGYAGTDGSTGNEAVWVRRTSGTVTITLDGTTQPSVRTDGATVNFVTGTVPLSVTVIDASSLLPIENVQTSIQLKDSPFTQLMNLDTNASGIASTNYGGSTGVDAVVKCRKAEDTDNPRYFAFSGIQPITGNGLELTVLLEQKPDIF